MSNVRTQLIAAAVRILADKDILIHKPDPFAGLFDQLFGQETYDVRIAKDVDAHITRASKTAKRILNKRRGIQKITTLD
jgi:hypothetical protein